jgi:hypothetical protein
MRAASERENSRDSRGDQHLLPQKNHALPIHPQALFHRQRHSFRMSSEDDVAAAQVHPPPPPPMSSPPTRLALQNRLWSSCTLPTRRRSPYRVVASCRIKLYAMTESKKCQPSFCEMQGLKNTALDARNRSSPCQQLHEGALILKRRRQRNIPVFQQLQGLRMHVSCFECFAPRLVKSLTQLRDDGAMIRPRSTR